MYSFILLESLIMNFIFIIIFAFLILKIFIKNQKGKDILKRVKKITDIIVIFLLVFNYLLLFGLGGIISRPFSNEVVADVETASNNIRPFLNLAISCVFTLCLVILPSIYRFKKTENKMATMIFNFLIYIQFIFIYLTLSFGPTFSSNVTAVM